jgi:hypothetical protein
MKSLLLFLTACVAEHDPDIFVTLPQSCTLLDAARLDLDVTTPQGEKFTVSSASCESQLAGQNIEGFAVELERIADGYPRFDARLATSSGAHLGELSQPFDAAAPIVIAAFGRADLPGWPTARITLAPPACESTLHVVATPVDEINPVVEMDLPCDAPIVDLPRGDTRIVATVPLASGCIVATTELVVTDDATSNLLPAGACP